MSVLQEWYGELRDDGKTEAQALEVIAQRLGEPVIETKRIMSMIAGVKLRGRPQRNSRPSGDSRVQAPVNGDGRPGGYQEPDVRALRDFYREQRKSGRGIERAVKSVAREFDRRPHDVRRLVGVVEYDLRAGGA